MGLLRKRESASKELGDCLPILGGRNLQEIPGLFCKNKPGKKAV